MKRTFILLLAAVTVCAGCAKAADTETLMNEPTRTAETTAAAAETAASEEAGDDDEHLIPQIEVESEPPMEYQVFSTREIDTSEMPFYKGDGVTDEYGVLRFFYTYCYRTTGASDDSDANPENFDEYEYKGDIREPEGFLLESAGETEDGKYIKYVETVFSDGMLMSSRVEYGGEIEMTGYLQYFYDDDYAISSGDMVFIPESFGGFSVPVYGYNTRVRRLTKRRRHRAFYRQRAAGRLSRREFAFGAEQYKQDNRGQQGKHLPRSAFPA